MSDIKFVDEDDEYGFVIRINGRPDMRPLHAVQGYYKGTEKQETNCFNDYVKCVPETVTCARTARIYWTLEDAYTVAEESVAVRADVDFYDIVRIKL